MGKSFLKPLHLKHYLTLFIVLGLVILACAGLVATPRPAYADAEVGDGSAGSCNETTLNNALAIGGLVTFKCGAIPLTITISSQKNIALNTIIDGGNLVTISGEQNTRLFFVNENSNLSFTVKNLRLVNGKTTGQGAAIHSGAQTSLNVLNTTFNFNVVTSALTTGFLGGGAIYLGPGATASISNSLFTANEAPNGGAISSYNSSLTIEGSTFRDNISRVQSNGGGGGAIYSRSEELAPLGNLTIENSLIDKNSAAFQGGGILSYNGPEASKQTNINNTTISNNKAGYNSVSQQAFGGGIYNGQGVLNLSNSTLYANKTTFQGGGMWSGNNAFVTLSNVTVAENGAYNGNAQGGGIFRGNGPFTLTNVTITGNYAGLQGGGIEANTPAGNPNMTLTNSIVTYNTSGTGLRANCSVELNDGGNNLQWPGDARPGSNSDNYCVEKLNIIVAEPKLALFSDAGGPTATLGLLEGSPALDTANCATAPAKDQRGVARPVGASCDIGAFEGVIRPPTLSKAFAPATVEVGGTTRLVFTLNNPSTVGTVLSNVSFGDNLPSSLKVATPPGVTHNCGNGTNVTAGAGSGNIGVLGASVGGGQSCTIGVSVVSSAMPNTSALNTITLLSAKATGSQSVNVQATLQTIALKPPSSLSATALSSSEIKLSWADNSSAESGYRIERSPDGLSSWAEIDTVGPNVTSYTNTSLNELTTSYYRVRAFNAVTTSSYSNVASATTGLAAPTMLTATVAGPSQINLSWRDNSNLESGYRVERRTLAQTSWTVISGTLPTNSENYADTGLASGVVYYYRVQAYNSGHTSAYSNEASAITPGAWIVSKSTDDGTGGTSGTLSYALTQIALTNPLTKTITFDLPMTNTVTITGATFPDLPTGVTIGGSCSNGPGIVIVGPPGLSSFKLKGGIILYGVKLTGFSGPLLATQPATPNRLACVRVSRP